MTQIEEQIGSLLIASDSSLCTAESFTSGALASRITSVPGASAYFRGAIVAYSEKVKSNLLEVSTSLIETHGVVCVEVAEAMALGARKLLESDYALATTGIAGPGGGTEETSVGTVCLAIVGDGICKSWRLKFDGDRKCVVEQSISRVLRDFRDILAGNTE